MYRIVSENALQPLLFSRFYTETADFPLYFCISQRAESWCVTFFSYPPWLNKIMNEIKIFENPEFGAIRTMELPDGQVGFVGKDVAEVLGYSRTADAIRTHVEDDDKGVFKMPTPGGLQQVTFINESGLYSLILSSKLPTARAFKRWVTSEVLPQIRQTGGYIPLKEEDDEKTILAKAVQILQKTVEQKQSIIEMRELEIKNQDKQLEKQRPMVEFAQAVSQSEDTCTIAELAKLLYQKAKIEVGQNRLFQWMREHLFLCTAAHHRNEPFQKWVETGYFTLKNSEPWYDRNGMSHYSVTPLVTGKGQEFFVTGFLNGKFHIFNCAFISDHLKLFTE